MLGRPCCTGWAVEGPYYPLCLTINCLMQSAQWTSQQPAANIPQDKHTDTGVYSHSYRERGEGVVGIILFGGLRVFENPFET